MWYWRVATTGTASRVPYSRYFWSIMRLLEYCERQKEERGRDERIIWKIGKPFLIKTTPLASLVAIFAVICPGYTVQSVQPDIDYFLDYIYLSLICPIGYLLNRRKKVIKALLTHRSTQLPTT